MINLLSRKTAWLVLMLIFCITIFFGLYFIKHVYFSNDLENYYPKGDQSIELYNRYKQSFLDSNSGILVSIRTQESMLQWDRLKALELVTKSIKQLPQVNRIYGLTNLQKLVNTPLTGPMMFPYLDLNNDAQNANTQNIINESELIGTFISKDFNGVCLQLFVDYNLTPEDISKLKSEIHSILTEQNFNDYFILGRAVGQQVIINTLKREMTLYLLISIVLILFILLVLYRSFWGVVRPCLLLLISVIWTLGVMALCNKPIDVLSSIVPAIIFVIGTSDVVHIYERYLQELRLGQNRNDALVTSFKQVGLATLITSITTMIGFLTLLMSNVQPIQEFGLSVAAGVAITYILTYSLFPALLILTPMPQLQLRAVLVRQQLLERLFSWTFRNKRYILLTSILLAATGIGSVFSLKINNHLTEDLPSGSRYREGYQYLDEQFSGARPLEIAIELKNPSAFDFSDLPVLKQMEKLDDFMRRAYHTNATFSILQLQRQLWKADHENTNIVSVFQDESYYNQHLPIIKRFLRSEKMAQFVDEQNNMARIAGFTRDVGGATITKTNQKLMQFAMDSCNLLDVNVTGVAHLIDESNRQIPKDMLKGLMFAFLLIGALMALLFRSAKIVIIALIPNVLPLLTIALVMALSGIEIKISTVLIFTIAFGIVVDDSIHFLSKMKQQLDFGKSLHEAIRTTYFTTGSSIIITSLILCFGFISLSFSDFTSTSYLGILVSITLLFGVLADLFLLPILLMWLRKGK